MLAPELNLIAATFARTEVEREVALQEEVSMIQQLSRSNDNGGNNDNTNVNDDSMEEDGLATEGWLLPPMANASADFRRGEHKRRHTELSALSKQLPALLARISSSATSSSNLHDDGGDENIDDANTPPSILSPRWVDMYRASKDFADEALVLSKGLQVEDLAQCKQTFADTIQKEFEGSPKMPSWFPPKDFFDSVSAPHTKVFRLGEEKRWFAAAGDGGSSGGPRDVLADLEALLFEDEHLEELQQEQLIYGNNGGSKARYEEVKRSTIGPVRGRDVKDDAPGTAALLGMAKHASPEHRHKRSSSKLIRSGPRSTTTTTTTTATGGDKEGDGIEDAEDGDGHAVSKGIRSELFKATRRWECLMLLWSKWVVTTALKQQPATTTSSHITDALNSVDLCEFIKGYFNTIVHERVFLTLSKIVRPDPTTATPDGNNAKTAAEGGIFSSSMAGRRYSTSPPPTPTKATGTSTTTQPPRSVGMPFGKVNAHIVVVKGKQKSIRTLTDFEKRLVMEEDAWLVAAGYDSSYKHTGTMAASDRAEGVELLRSQSSTKWKSMDEGSCRKVLVLQSHLRRRLAIMKAQTALKALTKSNTSSSRLSMASRRISTAVMKQYTRQSTTQRQYIQSCMAIAKDTALCEKFYSTEEATFKQNFKAYITKATEHYLNNVPLELDWTVEKTPIDNNGGVEIRYVNLRSGRSQTENPNMLKVSALKQRELAKATRKREEAYRDMDAFVKKLNTRKEELDKLEKEMSATVSL